MNCKRPLKTYVKPKLVKVARLAEVTSGLPPRVSRGTVG
jgi:hypothetical protein